MSTLTADQYYSRLVGKAVKGVRRQHTSNKRGLCLGSLLGNVADRPARVQSYLVGDIHHQVITFVSVAVLKRSGGRVSLEVANKPASQTNNHSHICSCCPSHPLCVSWGRGCNPTSRGASRSPPAGCRTATPSYSAKHMQPNLISLQLPAIFLK